MGRVKRIEIIRSCVQDDSAFDLIVDGHREDILGVDALYKRLDEIFKPKNKKEECLHLDDLLVPCGVGEITSSWDKRLRSN